MILEEAPYRSRGILFLPDWAGPADFCKGPQRGSVTVFQGLQAVRFLLSCSAPPLKLRAAPGPTDERPWPVELCQSVAGHSLPTAEVEEISLEVGGEAVRHEGPSLGRGVSSAPRVINVPRARRSVLRPPGAAGPWLPCSLSPHFLPAGIPV